MKDYLYVEGDVKSIVISDIHGKVVLSTTSSPIYVGNLHKGVFIISVETDDRVINNHKLIVTPN